MAELIDGRVVAARVLEGVAGRVKDLKSRGVEPALAVILVGDDPASHVYVKRKIADCARVGITSIEHRLPAETKQADLIELIEKLNMDRSVNGILVQLPLPASLDALDILDRILPEKDVDGFHPVNVGRLSTGTGGIVPCTPGGIIKLLDTVIPNYRGLNAVVIGRSNIVGKPVALLLLAKGASISVTHSGTVDLPDMVRRADIVVAATGVPELVRGYWIKPGAVVIDVGINRVDDGSGKTKLVGDCATSELSHAKAVTPVPGGVGPMTIACLLENTVTAAEKSAA